jgi:hypothetical protein
MAVLEQYHDELRSRQMAKLQVATDQAILNKNCIPVEFWSTS